jgi:hypothetical protein
MLRTCFFFICLGIFQTASFGQLSEKAFSAFTRCDAEFFNVLNEEEGRWPRGSLTNKDKISWITVTNRFEEKCNSVSLPTSIAIKNLSFSAFHDEISDLDGLGVYLFWGFVVRGTNNDVFEGLKSLVHDANRLRKSDDHFVRSEVSIDAGKTWLPSKRSAGTAPGSRLTERVLIFEPGEKSDEVKVFCSLQGRVNSDLLKINRPDIPEDQHPNSIASSAFEAAKVPALVTSELQRVKMESIWLDPKFKELSFDLQLGNSPDIVSTVVKYDDTGVFHREFYSNSFIVLRQMGLSGLVQLKSKIQSDVIDSKMVRVTQKLKARFPAELNIGERVSIHHISEDVSKDPKSPAKPFESQIECEVGQSYPAQTINVQLTGLAIAVSCGLKTASRQDYAYVVDLGYFLTRSTTSITGGSAKTTDYRYIKFAVVR